jgi:hypothetical protein
MARTGKQTFSQAVRSGERAILTPQDTEDCLLWQTAYQNGPTPCIRRRAEDVQAALTKVDKSSGHSGSLEQLDESVDRVTLADTTKIETSPRGKFNPAIGRQLKGGTRDRTGYPG